MDMENQNFHEFSTPVFGNGGKAVIKKFVTNTGIQERKMNRLEYEMIHFSSLSLLISAENLFLFFWCLLNIKND